MIKWVRKNFIHLSGVLVGSVALWGVDPPNELDDLVELALWHLIMFTMGYITTTTFLYVWTQNTRGSSSTE